jgi:hypothetical protein
MNTIYPTIVLLFGYTQTIQSQLNVNTLDYYSKLYDDLFTGYRKQTGPWRNASVSDNGTELVMVQVSSDLYAIDSVVSDKDFYFIFYRISFIIPPHICRMVPLKQLSLHNGGLW